MEDRPNIKAHRAWQLVRLEVMRKHNGEDSDEEDALLDAADVAWWAMSDEEREYIRTHKGPYDAETVKWLDKGTA